MIDVSFITINYNSSEYTTKLVDSIIKNSLSVLYEIIIVDNASEEKDFLFLKEFIQDKENIKLIKNSINTGFASGNMLGVNYARGRYYFFINNDCLLLNNTAKILKEISDENKEIALATGKVLDDKGNYSSSYKQFPHVLKQLYGNSVQRFFSKNKFPSNKIKLEKNSEVEVVSGSCMFFDADTFNKIGGFDTVFFLYCEEEDISKRVWDYGKKVYFIPQAEVYHKAGASTKQSFLMEREFYISYYHLLDKHFNKIEKFLLKFALFFKLFFRIFKKKNGFKIFLCMLSGFSKKNSLRYKQKINKIGG
jgi:GT2 family glycosyltransferase